MNEEIIKDKLTKTCTCKQITKHVIKEAIQKGAKDLDAIKETTGAMTGCCKGSRCKQSIVKMLEEA